MDLVCLYTFIGCGAAVLAGADYNAVGILIIVFYTVSGTAGGSRLWQQECWVL